MAELATLAHTPNKDDAPAKTDAKRGLTLTEKADVLRRHRQHPEMSFRQLGEFYGVHHSTISAVVKDGNATASAMLEVLTPQWLEDWSAASRSAAEKGDHRPAKDALLHAGKIEQIGARLDVRFSVEDSVGDGSRPIGPPPVFAEGEIVPTFACSTQGDSADFHKLSGDIGSDNGGYVKPADDGGCGSSA